MRSARGHHLHSVVAYIESLGSKRYARDALVILSHPSPSLCPPESMSSKSRKAVVVGAGPVGCLMALALAKRGWSVDLYEGRPDK